MSGGFFITFEGGEGSGKTTQINRLSRALSAAGRKVVTTREPGGTPEGEKIRECLVRREGGNWTPMAEALLLFAARAMHVEKVIRPALDQGKIVISDRFTDSTAAYQGYGHGLPAEMLESLKTLVLGGFTPDLTIVLDIDPETGLRRSRRRIAGESFSESGESEDRFERLDTGFHERLRHGFLEIAAADPERCRVVDASGDLDEIAAQIEALVKSRL